MIFAPNWMMRELLGLLAPVTRPKLLEAKFPFVEPKTEPAPPGVAVNWVWFQRLKNSKRSSSCAFSPWSGVTLCKAQSKLLTPDPWKKFRPALPTVNGAAAEKLAGLK